MQIRKISIHQEDKTTTTINAFQTDISAPLGSILILHDWEEHQGRYKEFADYLNKKGYDVYLYDQRGHGSDIRFEDLGHIANNDGWTLLITDAVTVLNYIRKNNRGEKLVLFGNGMGSQVARIVIAQYPDIDACILCATSNSGHYGLNHALFRASFIKLTKGGRQSSPFLANKLMEFKDFSKISDRTTYDWISRDNKVVGSYINDPLCGFVGTASFYCDILNLGTEAASPRYVRHTRTDFPILLLGGSHDPVSGYADDVADLFDLYQHYHFTNTDCIIYDEARHELLHEINKKEIMCDISDWLTKVLFRLKPAEQPPVSSSKKHNKSFEPDYNPEEITELKNNFDDEASDEDSDLDAALEDLGFFDRSSVKSNEKNAKDESKNSSDAKNQANK